VSVMIARAMAKRAATRDAQDEDLIGTITDVITQVFPELLVAALADPEVRVEIHRAMARPQRAAPGPTRRAAEIKASRGRG
jgi:hypothetical protein